MHQHRSAQHVPARRPPAPIYDSYAPRSRRLSDAFAEVRRALATFETVPGPDTFRILDAACLDLKVTLHLTPGNAAYFAHLDRYQAYDGERRALKRRHGF